MDMNFNGIYKISQNVPPFLM